MNYSPPPTLYVDAEGVHALRALAPDDLAQATVDAYRQFKRGGWTFAVLLAKAYEARAWRPRYATFPEWGRDGIGIADTNRLFKYRRAGAFILERPLEEQARWLNVPVSNVLEALPDARKDPLWRTLRRLESCHPSLDLAFTPPHYSLMRSDRGRCAIQHALYHKM